jgi:hypothetical protein
MALLALAGGGERAWAQAWPQAPGSVYAKLAYGTATASEQYSFDGRVRPYADGVDEDAFFDRSLYAYAEAGLTPDVTLVVAAPLRRVFVRDAAFRYRTYGFGSINLGARVGLKPLLGVLGDADALAVNAALTLPTGYTRNRTPSVGTGQVDAELALAYGRSLHPIPAYAQVSAGYRYRSSFYSFSRAVECQEGVDLDCLRDLKPDYSDELTATAEAGYTFGGRLLVQAMARGVYSVEKPETAFSVANPLPTRQRALKVGGGAALALPGGVGLSAQVFYTPVGRNTVRSLDLFLGLDGRFRLPVPW